jgi:hypothetical protein
MYGVSGISASASTQRVLRWFRSRAIPTKVSLARQANGVSSVGQSALERREFTGGCEVKLLIT